MHLSTVLLTATVLTNLVFLLFPVGSCFSSSSRRPNFTGLIPARRIIHSRPSSRSRSKGLGTCRGVRHTSSLFLTTARSVIAPRRVGSDGVALTGEGGVTREDRGRTKGATRGARRASSRAREDVRRSFGRVCRMTSTTLPSTRRLAVGHRNSGVIVSALSGSNGVRRCAVGVGRARSNDCRLLPLTRLGR